MNKNKTDLKTSINKDKNSNGNMHTLSTSKDKNIPLPTNNISDHGSPKHVLKEINKDNNTDFKKSPEKYHKVSLNQSLNNSIIENNPKKITANKTQHILKNGGLIDGYQCIIIYNSRCVN